ncbi:MAG TPA: hypothetical protein VE959_17830 [Bryobacteraceae bacterium]|nr:hypothetical protein [Bryobacteraceae bacterium]
MRIASPGFGVGRYLAAVAGPLALLSAAKKTGFTKYDKAYYADAATWHTSQLSPNLGSVCSTAWASAGQ